MNDNTDPNLINPNLTNPNFINVSPTEPEKNLSSEVSKIDNPYYHIDNIIQDTYKILDMIGIGSFGKVFLGEDLITSQYCVIKIIEKSQKNFSDKIKRETQIPKLIIHENIIKILDVIESEKYCYVIYPYIEGSRPLSLISNNKLNFHITRNLIFILDIFEQICTAVEFMHKCHVRHRDLKTDNIIIGNKTAFIIDFDLAYVVNSDEYYLKKGTIGSPMYMAPEIWSRYDNVDYVLSDIYSMGITFYFCLNKKKFPYDDHLSVEDLEYCIFNKQPINSNCGRPLLDKLVMAMINRNPIRRPSIARIKSTINEFRQSL